LVSAGSVFYALDAVVRHRIIRAVIILGRVIMISLERTPRGCTSRRAGTVEASTLSASKLQLELKEAGAPANLAGA